MALISINIYMKTDTHIEESDGLYGKCNNVQSRSHWSIIESSNGLLTLNKVRFSALHSASAAKML